MGQQSGGGGGGGGGASPLQLAVLSAAAAALGLAAGAAVVYWKINRDTRAETARDRRYQYPPSDSSSEWRHGLRYGGNNRDRDEDVNSRGSSVSNVVPLFDSVQKWLRTNSSTSPLGSAVGLLSRTSRQSLRSNVLSVAPGPVPEDAEYESPNGSRGGDIGGSGMGGGRGGFADGMPLSDWEIREEDIEICRRPDGNLWHLGAGSYGQVFKAMRGGVQPVAVKVFPSDATDMQMAEFQKEVVILKSCRDRNIVQFLGACVTDTQTCLVTEFMEMGDLYNALHRGEKAGMLTWYKKSSVPNAPRPNPPVQGLGRRIALDISRGLHFLHTHRIVHMDVKTPNVLLGRTYIAKLADVGLAKFLHKDYLSAAKSVGTFAWSAPEVLMGGRCSEKVDIFSFGVVLWEIVTGESPARGRLRSVRVPEECSEAVADLIAACMEADPADRPSAREIVEMLSATGNERALQSAADRRKEARAEVGAISARVLDDLCRHAGVVGVKPFTRSDAVLAAAMKDNLRLYKCYLAQLTAVMPGGEAPARDTPQHARMMELVSSFRQLLGAYLAEFTDTTMELRNININQANRPAGDADMPDSTQSAIRDGQISTLGKREETVDWRPSIAAMKLSPEQLAAVLEARSTVTFKIEELTQERKELISSLHGLAMSGQDDGYGSAVDKTDELRRNMKQEGTVLHEYHYWFMCVMLTPAQHAACELASLPFFPDPMAISDTIVRDAVHAMAGAKHSDDDS